MATDWEEWRTVLATARAGTLAGAAAALGVDATTAGRRVRALEERLGRRLFEREGTKLRPTPICADAIPSLDAADEALTRAEEIAAGAAPTNARTVRITSVSLLCDHVLAPAMPRLLAARRLRVELIADNRNLSLPRREADAALRLGPPSGDAPARHVGSLRYAVYTPRGYDPDALPWVGFDTTLSRLPEFRWVERAAGRDGPAFRVNRMEAAKALVLAGPARALLPRIIGDASDELVRVGAEVEVERPLWLILNSVDADAPHMRAVARWIEECCARL